MVGSVLDEMISVAQYSNESYCYFLGEDGRDKDMVHVGGLNLFQIDKNKIFKNKNRQKIF